MQDRSVNCGSPVPASPQLILCGVLEVRLGFIWREATSQKSGPQLDDKILLLEAYHITYTVL